MTVITKTEARVCSITFARHDKRNALTNEMYLAAASALLEADRDDDTAVVLLSGGDFFCAGNDVGDFLAYMTAQVPMQAPAFLDALCSATKPIVACVRGAAIGVGLTMLAHCDYVVAADSARLQAPFARLELYPEAARWLLLGESISAEEAHAAGLITEVVADSEAELRALNVCHALTALPGPAVRATKRLLKAPAADAVRAAMEREGKAFSELLANGTAASALKSFGARSRA
jgi:enoyl-CoA hydratase/carnithine racemase